MASLVLAGDTSGTITVSAPAVAGSNTQTLVATTGTLAPIVSGTAVSASGTSVDFTGIPSWVKRITVMFSGVSTNGSSLPIVRVGAGSIVTTGYAGNVLQVVNAAATSGSISTSAGFYLWNSWVSTYDIYGQLVLTLISGNTWVASGTNGSFQTAQSTITNGSIALSGALDRVRITTINGTDTFDAGTINLLWE